MFNYLNYTPWVCIAVLVIVIFLIWFFCSSDKKYKFVGMAPLNSETAMNYGGSVYGWDKTDNGTTDVHSIPIDTNVTIVSEIEMVTTPELIQVSPPKETRKNEEIIPEAEATSIIIPVETVINSPEPNESKSQPISAPASASSYFSEDDHVKPYNSNDKIISEGEKLCKRTLEYLYNKPFITVRPDWLKNPETGRNLELDCYNESLKLAVEYNGEQHYKWPNFTNQTKQEFLKQVERDDLKKKLCKENGVYLIVVPYTVKKQKIISYIISMLPETRARNEIKPQIS